jgi:uncharacterized repeat protein (TIGR01451 family)
MSANRARVVAWAWRSRRPLALVLALLSGILLLITSLWLLGHPLTLRAAALPIRYVAPAPWGNNAGNDCSSRHAPCATIQRAVAQADAGDEVRVAAGSYAGTVSLNQDLTLRGGFTITNWFVPDPDQHRTVIDGQGSGRALNVGASISPTVSGFDLTGGRTFDGDANGAGINNLGHLTLLESRIYENTTFSGGLGGGIYNAGSGWLLVRNTEIYSNTANDGAGFYVHTGTVVVEGGRIFANVSSATGGGGVMDGNSTLRNALIYGNTAGFNGGGIVVDGGTALIQNDTFYANDANWYGGGVLAWNGVVTITNGLFVSNTAGLAGGGIYSNTADLAVTYSDFYANALYHIADSSGPIGPSELDPGNNIRDPQFVDAPGFDLHLSPGSPAIDSGTSLAAVSTDFEGHGRPFGSEYDRGGDEFLPESDCYARLDHGRVYTDVQVAVDAASTGSLVQVAGRCTGVRARDGTSQTVHLNQSVTLRGGYTVTNWSSGRYGPTVLDAQGLGRVVLITATAQITPRIENLYLTGGYASGLSQPGAGVYIGPNAVATLENNVVLENEATYGGGAVAVDGGATAYLRHNTLYSNTAPWGAGVYAHGTVFLENSAVVTNTATSGGGGIFEAGGGTFVLRYNDFYGNTPDNYGGTVTTGTTDLTLTPGFVDVAGGDFHLDYVRSAIVNRADPASPVTSDFEGDVRPLGLRSDVGADESWYYADLLLDEAPESPVVVTDTGQIENSLITFTHAITNLSSLPVPTDTFDLVTDNSAGWDVTLVGINSPAVLTTGMGIAFQAVVSVPNGLPATLHNETVITATSRANDAAQAVVVDAITTPGMNFFPDHSEAADPDEVVTYTHTLINTGDGEDTFTLVLDSSRGWSQLVEPAPVVTGGLTTTVTLAAGESASVVVRVHVPAYAAAGLEDVTTVKSISGYSSAIFVTVVDTTTANSITGDRYVATVGDNVSNNCTQPVSPCATINYAIGQSAQGDSVLVAQGEYDNEVGTHIDIDLSIQLLGGYEYANGTFSPPSGGVDPADTIINANSGRGLKISVSPAFHPVVDGFTIKNGSLSGVGGGIYVEGSSAPTLTHLIIMECSGTQGGGIYVDDGDPVIQHVTISDTAAGGGGGGIYVNEGSPALEDIVISGAAADRGGGLYVLNGNVTASGLRIAHNEASDLGGGVYHAAGTVVLSQTHIVGNVAGAGGGFYSAGGSLTLWNNFIYSNTATTWSGGGVYKGGGTLELVNNTLYANTAQTFGGGVYDGSTLSAVISNTILVENAAQTGGGIYRDSTSSLSIDYNDLWNNAAASYPDSNVPTGVHSVALDPLFVDAAAGDLHLSPDSPVVDAGDPDTFLNLDIDGEMRPVNQGYDIGADELGGCLARVVSPGTGEQVGPVYGVVQEAIDAADPGYIVQVAGVCRGVLPRSVGGRVISQTAFISKSLTLEGGYESGFGDPGTGVSTSVLDAQGLGRAVVVTGSVYVRISHLTMTDGDATGLGGGPAGADAGGGVYNQTDFILRIEDSVISDSLGTYGGGLYSFGGTLVLSSTAGTDETQIVSNTATYGGGMFLGGGTPALRSVYLAGNAAEQGGGIYNAGAFAAFTQTEFYSNTAEVGGGLYNADGSLEGTRLTFVGNSATSGGGVYNGGGALLHLMRSVFLSNTVSNDGGGMYNAMAGDLTLVNTILAANRASNDGGGLFNRSDDLALRHGTFYGNYAADQGGGIYHDAATGAPVINSTLIIGNGAGTEGSGIYSHDADPDFDHNDVYDNTYGGSLDPGDGDGNLAVDPSFISTNPSSPYFLRLPPNSPVEDVADPASPVLIDIDGDPRPTNQGFDIGADEVGGCYVRINGAPPTYGNVQFAVRDSEDGDVLHVAGTCLGVNVAVDSAQTVSQTIFLTKSLTIRGGYTTTNWTEPDPDANVTTLDALGMGRVVYITNSPVVSVTGFHIRQGTGENGGAVFVRNGVLTMTHNHIYSSTATNGGALYNQGGSILLVGDNALFGNAATLGGGVYNAGGHFTLDDNRLYDNRADDGGAVYYASGSGVMQNNVVRDNQAVFNGGGVYNGGNSLTVRHNTFYQNAANDGGALYNGDDTPTVVNNLLVENTASAGDAIYSETPVSIDYNDVYPETGAYANVTPGPNSLAVDPSFVNPAGGDFHLQDDSPVIDQGDPTMTLLHDFDGDLRPGDQGFDMGADERRSCYARIVETGVVYGNIQRAVDHSSPGDHVQVTIGECRGVNTYLDGGQMLSQTVHITHDLTLSGGFNETFSNQCAGPQGYPDLTCATTFDAEGLGRVVLVTNTAVITMDRFNIVYGDATDLGGGPGGMDAGGGLYFNGPEGELTHVDFYSNTATYGGAFYNAGDHMLMENSWIHYNTAQDGGAIYNATGVLTVAGQSEGSIFTDNRATNRGGALFNASGQVWVVGNHLDNELGMLSVNQALQGGAIYNDDGMMVIEENTLSENEATDGGAVYNDTGTITLESNDILDNDALTGAGRGGGFFNNSGTATLDLGNRFDGNASGGSGGAIYSAGGDLTVWNQLIYRNNAINQGAGIYVGSGTPSVLHNTLYRNMVPSGTGLGGGIYVASGANPTIKNTIFYSNVANIGGGIYVAGSATIDYSNFYQNQGGHVSGAGTGVNSLVDVDPQLLNPGSGDFHLRGGSPLIDQAQDSAVWRDFEADPRPVNQGADIGADEVSDCLAWVSSSGIIYGRIQTAIDNANPGDVIKVAGGICQETITVDRDITISGSWYDEFAKQRDGIATTIDALRQNRAITVVSSVDQVNLSYLEIVSGSTTADGGGIWSGANRLNLDTVDILANFATDGGGLYVDRGRVSLSTVLVDGNQATGSGGGIYLSGGVTSTQDALLVFGNQALAGHGGGEYVGPGCVVDDLNGGMSFNVAGGDGGGMYIGAGSEVEVGGGLAFDYNQADNGGGVYIAGASFTLAQKRLNHNDATSGYGGGIYAGGSSTLDMTNLGLFSNSAQLDGGGLYHVGIGSAELYHATIRANGAEGRGGGVYHAASSMVVSATIVASNTAPSGAGIYGASNVNYAYGLRWNNDYFGVSVDPTSTNLVADPRFRSDSWGEGGDLLYTSPAIDAVPVDASHVLVDRFLQSRVPPGPTQDPQAHTPICARDMGRDEFVVQRNMDWTGLPDDATVLPSESVTHTFSLQNKSQNVTSGGGQVSQGIGSGYTETVTVTVNSSRGWAQIDTIDGASDVQILSGRQAAICELGPGDVADIQVVVTVPPGTYASVEDRDGTKEFTSITYETALCPNGPELRGTSDDVVTRVGEDWGFEIGPDRSGAAMPGQTVTYTHILTNTGNLTDTYTLYPNPGYYAAGEIAEPSPPQLTLTPLQTSTVVISVTIDPEAAGGLVDVTNVIAQSTTGKERGAADSTAISYTTGTRYVALNGSDSLVPEREGDPDAIDYLDNNCTQRDAGACRTIRHAIDQAADGDEIHIAYGTFTGTYTTTYQTQVITQVVFIDQPVVLRGGYDAADWDEDPPSHHLHPTRLDAQGMGRGIFITDGISVTVDRMVLVNGSADGLGGGPGDADAGGNLCNAGGDLTLTANRIYSGTAELGGGLYSHGGALLLQNDLLHDNQATDQGGAVYVYTGTARLENDTFYTNTATNEGAAVYAAGGLVISNTIFAGNASGSGGAVYASSAASTVDYALYHGNAPSHTGGTVPGPGPNDVLADPLFVGPAATPPDLHLQKESPAKDAADPTTTLDVDYDNSFRPLGPGFDIGAYERVPVQGMEFYTDHVTTTVGGAMVFFTHTLENTGDTTETFTIDATNSQGWPIELEQSVPYEVILAPGASHVVPVTITVPADAGGQTALTTITAAGGPPSYLSQSVVDTVHVRSAVWQLEKTVTPLDFVQPGGYLTYTLIVTNSGNLESTGYYTITDPLPDHTHFVSSNPPTIDTEPDVVWSLNQEIGIGEAISVTFVVSVTRPLTNGTPIVNQDYSVFGGGAPAEMGGDPVTVWVVSRPDLHIDKVASADPVAPGDWLTYTLTVTNTDAALGAAEAVVIRDTLPDELVYSSMGFVSPATGSLDDSGAPELVWILADPIPVGESVQLTVTGRVTSPLPPDLDLVNTCAVTVTHVSDWIEDALTTAVAATNEITLTKSVTPDLVATGDVVTYTVALTNTGDGVASVTLTDTLAAGFSPAAFTTELTVPGRTWTSSEGVATVVFTATAPATGGVYPNPEVTAAYDGAGLTIYDTAPVTVVRGVAGLSLVSDSPTLVGTDTTFTITLAAGSGVSYTLAYGDGEPAGTGTLIPGVPLVLTHTYATTGTYTAVVTATNAVSQLEDTTVVEVQEELADLVITDMWLEPTSLTAGEPISVHVTVHNQGWAETVQWDNPAEHGFWVEIYAKGSDFVPAGPPVDVYDHAGGYDEGGLDYLGWTALDRGQQVELIYQIVLTPTDVYTLYAQADVGWENDPVYQSFGQIRETNEENNIYTYGPAEIGPAERYIFLPLVLRQE